MIYFIHCPALNAIKIGVADNPEKRLATLQTGCPDRLVLLAIAPGGPMEEAQYHRRFAALRLRGEWFTESPDLMGEIHRHRLSLHPVPGTNPEGFPVPRHPLLESFRRIPVECPELSFVTSLAVGHAVSVASIDVNFAPDIVEALVGTRKKSYQVMRWSESDGPGKEFWDHHLWERPQWYATAEEACAAYVASYIEWRNGGGTP